MGRIYSFLYFDVVSARGAENESEGLCDHLHHPLRDSLRDDVADCAGNNCRKHLQQR